MKVFNSQGFVVFGELDVPADGSVQVEYKSGDYWMPACMYPNLTEEELQRPCNNQDWNWATQFMGFVQGYQIRDNQVYWHYCGNFDGVPEKKDYTVRVRRCAAGGKLLYQDIVDVTVDMGDVHFFNNFLEWKNVSPEPYNHLRNWRTKDPEDVPPGWYQARDEFGYPRLVSFGMGKQPEVSFVPGISGDFDLYFGVREQICECDFILPGGIVESVHIFPRNAPTTRFTKEFKLGNYHFEAGDPLIIARRSSTECNPERRFGDLLYVKFVPAAPQKPVRPDFAKNNSEIVFYSEPYSNCYYKRMQTPEQADGIAQKYQDLNVTTVVTQTGRVGCRMMHYSKLAGWIQNTTSGDDRQQSNGVMEAMENMDVMQELAKACRKRGMKFIGDIGVNSPYIKSPLESSWMTEHRDLTHPACTLFLDYTKEEVREFAASCYAELINDCKFDGISFNYTRYPYGGIDTEMIIDLQRRTVAKITAPRSEYEIHMSFVADLPAYYQALEVLLEENLVDAVTVGRLMSVDPQTNLTPYVELVHKYPGKKVFGKIDGWGSNFGGLNGSPLPTPERVETMSRNYLAMGADGIYFYQSEQILGDHFLRKYIKTLNC